MPITLGGSNHAAASAVASSIATAAFGTQPTAGSTIVVGIGWVWDNATSDTVTSVTDNAGNTYTRIGTQVEHAGSGARSVLYYAVNIATAGSFVVTANFTTGVADRIIAACELKGAHTSAPLDLYGGQSQSGVAAGTDAITTGSLGTPTTNNQAAVCFTRLTSWPDSLPAGTGWTGIYSVTGNTSYGLEYLVQTTATALAGTFTFDPATANPCTSAATFKEAASATLEQEGFRWYEDNGSESGSSASAAQDTNITAAAGATKRLRMLVNATGDPATTQFKLQWKKSGGSWADVL